MAKFFIEIGSCDFRTLAPLGEQGWQGILIEPVAELLDNIPRVEGLIYENCAITDYTGTTKIRYYDTDESKGEWVRGVGNINPDNNHFISNPQWKKWERTAKVPCYTLDDLIDKHKVKKIDLLKVDTEGHDYVILNNYSWKVKPFIVNCETIHEEMYGESGAIKKLLQEKGYFILDERTEQAGDNLTAVLM